MREISGERFCALAYGEDERNGVLMVERCVIFFGCVCVCFATMSPDIYSERLYWLLLHRALFRFFVAKVTRS